VSYIATGWLLVLSIGTNPFDKAARQELQALQDDWLLQSIAEAGVKHELGGDQRAILTFKGTKMLFVPTGEEGEIILLDTSTNPKIIDWKCKPKGREAFIREGIYKLDGDTLTLCIYKSKDRRRPTNFDPPKEADISLTTFKRVKP